MDKLGDILDGILAKKGTLRVYSAAEVCFYADTWGKGRFAAISFSRGVLKVSVDSASAAQELQMDSDKLIKHLNSKMGREMVVKVRIVNYS